MPKDHQQPPTHARQGSGGYDGMSGLPAQPIGRPAPIRRPGSIVHGLSREEYENPKHLGSRVLVEDDEPLMMDINTGGMRHQPPGLRANFGSSPFIDSGFAVGHNPWGPPTGAAQPFPPPGFGSPAWGAPGIPPGFNMASPVAGMATIRTSAQPRHVAVRLMLCQACKDLSSTGAASPDGYIDISSIKSHIDSQSGDSSASEQDLLNLCDTEGSASNGGGTFDVRLDRGIGKQSVRWVPDPNDGLGPHFRAVGAPGEIGSPVAGYASLRGI